jgi:hypothetical protein
MNVQTCLEAQQRQLDLAISEMAQQGCQQVCSSQLLLQPLQHGQALWIRALSPQLVTQAAESSWALVGSNASLAHWLSHHRCFDCSTALPNPMQL